MTARRSDGMGYLRPHGEGRWRFQFRAEDGTPLSRVFSAANETEANKRTAALRGELLAEHKARLAAVEKEKDAAGVERERRQEWTVEQYANFYFENWAKVHLASSTQERRRDVIDKTIIPAIGKMRMADVTATTLQELYGKLEKQKAYGKEDGKALAGASIWMVHTAIRAIFTFAVEVQEDFDRNPAARKTARPKVGQEGEAKRAVDVHEVELFVELVRELKPEIAVPVMLSAWLGTRRSETLALKRRDFDLEAGTATIRRSVTQGKTGEKKVVVKEWTKTSTRRIVPLDAHTIAAMRTLFAEQAQERLRFGKGWQGGTTPDDDWVCADASGAMMTPNHFDAVFRAFVKKHDLKMTPHLLRHALVSQLIAAGFDAVTISSITGHSPQVLLKTYAHAFDKRKQQAIKKIGAERQKARAAMRAVK